MKKRKRWREMSEIEIYLIKEQKCSRCIYAGGYVSGNTGYSSILCDYIGKTGHRRGCDPRDCEFWKEEGERIKRRPYE